MELYSEQAMLTALSRPREVMQFCWGSLYKNRVVTPIGLQLEAIDAMLSKAGDCMGVPCYLPPYAQGEDHLEDFLGMLGIPVEPVPEFPEKSKSVLLTAQALRDPAIMEKLRAFVAGGGRAVVTSGFAIGALGKGFEELSSIRYRGRRFRTSEFIEDGMMAPGSVFSRHEMSFPLLEHRTNTTWALAKGVCGEENYPLLLRDGYGRGQIYTLAVPDEYGYLYDLPAEVLRVIRSVFALDVPAYLEGPAMVSLFAYEGDVIALYPYVSGITRGRSKLVVKGVADALEDLRSGMRIPPERVSSFGDASTVFPLMLQQGDAAFYRIHWNEHREGTPVKKGVASAPHEF